MLFAAFALCSCNREETIVSAPLYPPRITLDSPSGIYEVKAGERLTIAPEVKNSQNAVYCWTMDGDTVCTDAVYTVVFDVEGQYYLTFTAVNADGSASEQMRIDVAALQPPVISLPLPSKTLSALTGTEYLFEASVKSPGPAEVRWTQNGVDVCVKSAYVFSSDTAGVFDMVFSATNDDGTSSVEFRIEVSHTLPIEISFPRFSSFDDAFCRSISLGQSLFLCPTVRNVSSADFAWEADGRILGTQPQLVYTPEAAGVSTLVLTVIETNLDGETVQGVRRARMEIEVVCTDPASVKRAATGGSSAEWDRVYEYMPAPGQFINESKSGFRDVVTMSQACDYADGRMREQRYVSLGAFGGYIIVGFDHSIENRGAYMGCDFSVKGNQFDTSSEPGVVWVMQDSNGNGLPDDEWYELAGSQTDAQRGCAVTYYRPAAAGSAVTWTDDAGGRGEVEYQGIFHTQDFYYPLWVAQDAYTLYGTRLESRVSVNPKNKQWVMEAYPWGYADNFGSDMLSEDGNPQAGPAKVYFKIDNAVRQDGTAVRLEYVDFIRVQTGVMAQAGTLGEVSTEVLGFEDENLHR